MKKIFILAIAALSLLGCKRSAPLLPNVSGKAGEIVVVMDKDNWDGTLGNEVRDLLTDECPYLAMQEPMFSLVNVTPSGFSNLFKVHRNIIYFNINPQLDSTGVSFYYDHWARTQCLVYINACDADEASQLFAQKGATIMRAVEQAERDRVIYSTKRYEDINITKKISEYFPGTLHFPNGYTVRKANSDFIWIADDKQYVYQDIFIYRYPAEKDHPFTSENIISHRNEILKENVPGSVENSYMTTSEYFTPQIEYLKYKGRDLTQTRGMWEVVNDAMGGPFVSHSFYSPDGSEIYVTEAFVYAPRFDKRQYLRQVEAILYTWEWLPEEDKQEGDK